MRAGRLPRRAALQIGAVVVVSGLAMVAGQIVHAQGSQPAPAQIPRPIAPAAPSATTGPLGTWRWQRTEYSDGKVIAAPDPSQYTVALLGGGVLAIQADCNRGGGRYTVDGPRLTLQPGPITLAACPPGSQDSAFLRDLRDVATYVMDGENLVLNMKLDTGNMVFSPQPPTAVTGVTWRVLGVNNGRGGVTNVIPDTRLSATFGDDGTVTGVTGCNSFRGTYTLDGTGIIFGPMVTTRRACLSEQAAMQEQNLLDALTATSTFDLAGDRLTLRSAAGATQVTLVR